MLNLYPSESSPTLRLPRVDVCIGRGVANQRTRTIVPPVFVIGTSPDCDLVVTDQQFDDYHAYIMVAEDRVMLRHLGSQPEITVNQRIIRWAELCHGDRLRMGPYEFRIRIWPVASESELEQAVRSPVDQQMADYEPPPALSWTAANEISDAWSHVLPVVGRFSDW